MCPVCFATAALIAGKVTSAGGLAAIAIKKFGGKNAVDNTPAQPDPSCFRQTNGAVEITPNSRPRRNQDVNQHD
jgi:hypothetical protein